MSDRVLDQRLSAAGTASEQRCRDRCAGVESARPYELVICSIVVILSAPWSIDSLVEMNAASNRPSGLASAARVSLV